MIIGLDISTSVVGIACFSNEGKLLKLHCVNLKSTKFKDSFDKLARIQEEMEIYRIAHESGESPITSIAIEEPMQKMQGKNSSAYTIAILNFFNGMVSGYLHKAFGIKPVHYNVTSARKLSFPDIKLRQGSQKHQVLEKVMENEPKINWKYSKRTGKIDQTCYDMADAYVIGMTDFLVRKKREENS